MSEPAFPVTEPPAPLADIADAEPALPPSRSLTHKTASGVAWMSLVQVVRQLLQLASVSVLARHIPPAAYGLVGMATLVTNFMETLRDAGMGYALVREREASRALVSTVFWLNLAFGATATLVVVAASWPAAYFFHEQLVAPILQFLAVAFFLGGISVVPTAMLNRAMKFRSIAIAQTSGLVVGTTVAITMALSGKGVWSLVVANLSAAAVTALLLWVLAPTPIGFVFCRHETRHILHFGLNLTGFNFVNYFARNADNLLVGRYLGSAPLGFYQMGYMLMTYPINNFSAVVAQVVYPALASLQDDLERLRLAYMRACRLISLLTFPLMFGMAVTAGPFVQVLLGPRWTPVAALLMVFGPLGAIQSIFTTTGLIYNTTGRTDVQFRWSTLCSVAYVASFVVGLRWGLLGVASCYAVVWMLLMVPSFLIPFRLIDLGGNRFLQALWPTTAYTLIMTALAVAWRLGLHATGMHNALLEFVTTVALGAATYIGLLYWRRPPVLEECSAVLGSSSNPMLRAVARMARL